MSSTVTCIANDDAHEDQVGSADPAGQQDSAPPMQCGLKSAETQEGSNELARDVCQATAEGAGDCYQAGMLGPRLTGNEPIKALLSSDDENEAHERRAPGSDEASQAGLAGAAVELEIERLTQLSSIEYEHERQEVAKRLGVRVTALDRAVKEAAPTARRPEPKAPPPVTPRRVGGGSQLGIAEIEPWPESVSGTELLSQLSRRFKEHVQLSQDGADVAALWVVHSHAPEASFFTPRLAITSPVRRCGKTTMLRLLACLVNKPMKLENITTAALYRTVEAAKPTILIDEADTFMDDQEALRGILNSGHAQDGRVIRCDADPPYEPRAFRTFCPVAIARIGRLPGTLQDRSIEIPLSRRRRNEHIKSFRLDRGNPFLSDARKAARWARDHSQQLLNLDPAIPLMNDRAADNWRPLVAIADLVGGEWPDRARRAALALSASPDESDDLELLLADIRDMFEESRTDRLYSQAIVEKLVAIEERPWAEYDRGRPLTPSKLARLLKPLGVYPGTIRTEATGAGTAKGYYRTRFEDAFTRYLPPSQRHNAWETGRHEPEPSVTEADDVTTSTSVQPTEAAECDGVTPSAEQGRWLRRI